MGLFIFLIIPTRPATEPQQNPLRDMRRDFFLIISAMTHVMAPELALKFDTSAALTVLELMASSLPAFY
jgi:hypothetical protein